MVDPGDDQVGPLADQAEVGEADAVDRGAVGGVADGAVVEVDLLDPERRAGGDRARRRAAVGVGRDRRGARPRRSRAARGAAPAARGRSIPSSLVSRTRIAASILWRARAPQSGRERPRAGDPRSSSRRATAAVMTDPSFVGSFRRVLRPTPYPGKSSPAVLRLPERHRGRARRGDTLRQPTGPSRGGSTTSAPSSRRARSPWPRCIRGRRGARAPGGARRSPPPRPPFARRGRGPGRWPSRSRCARTSHSRREV